MMFSFLHFKKEINHKTINTSNYWKIWKHKWIKIKVYIEDHLMSMIDFVDRLSYFK